MRPTNSILGQHFTIARQLRFTLPRMLMSLFIMSYMVADGVLISRYMGTVALASLNMIFPLAIFLGAVGIMLSAGGGSVVSRRMGRGDSEGADRALSTVIYAEFAFGLVVGLLGILVLPLLLDFLHVNEEQYAYAYDYQVVWLAFVPVFLLSVLFQTFFTVSGYPKLGLTVSGGFRAYQRLSGHPLHGASGLGDARSSIGHRDFMGCRRCGRTCLLLPPQSSDSHHLHAPGLEGS